MKTIEVKIIPNAKKNSVVEINGKYKVHVMAPAVDGLANKALIDVLAEYFQLKKRNISIVRGETSRTKFINIDFD
jgi:uncharacterized protein (TIGR00251 family)